MGFFDDLPAPQPAPPRRHPWEPPEAEFPGIVPIDTLLLGRTDQVAVAVTGLARSNADLSDRHHREHYKYRLGTGHVHIGDESPVVDYGIGRGMRPEGWSTGKGAMDKIAYDRQMRDKVTGHGKGLTAYRWRGTNRRGVAQSGVTTLLPGSAAGLVERYWRLVDGGQLGVHPGRAAQVGLPRGVAGVEEPAAIHMQFLTAGLADEIQLAIAPFFVGDALAPRFVEPGIFPNDAAHRMTLAEARPIGDVALLRLLPHHRPS